MSCTANRSVIIHRKFRASLRVQQDHVIAQVKQHTVEIRQFLLDPLKLPEPDDEYAALPSTPLLSLKLIKFPSVQLPAEIFTWVELQALVVTRRYMYDSLTLSDNIAQLKDLVYLKCRYTQLEALPSAIGQLQQLRYLNCSYNNLNALPESVYQLKQLNYLNVSSQRRGQKILSDAICQLKQLSSLICSWNRLAALPNAVGQLQNLECLECQGNDLVLFPEGIGQLQRLRYLNCSDNRLDKLPDAIINLKKLEHLDCSGNLLTKLPSDFTPLQKLTYFNCSQNSALHALPEFGKQLKELDCSLSSIKMCMSGHRARQKTA